LSEEVNWGLAGWLDDHPTLPWIIDFRVGYNMSDHSRLSVVVSNLLNEEYSIRPLAIESPRLTNIVYTYEIE
jgi:outer membrane receptor protein involved in Fe transport